MAYVSDSQYACEIFFALSCINYDGPSNNPYICLGLWEKKLKHIFTDWSEISFEKLNFINLDRYPICQAIVEHRAETTF